MANKKDEQLDKSWYRATRLQSWDCQCHAPQAHYMNSACLKTMNIRPGEKRISNQALFFFLAAKAQKQIESSSNCNGPVSQWQWFRRRAVSGSGVKSDSFRRASAKWTFDGGQEAGDAVRKGTDRAFSKGRPSPSSSSVVSSLHVRLYWFKCFFLSKSA